MMPAALLTDTSSVSELQAGPCSEAMQATTNASKLLNQQSRYMAASCSYQWQQRQQLFSE